MGAHRCRANRVRRGRYTCLPAEAVDCASCGSVCGGRSGVEWHLGESEDCLVLWRGQVHLETFGRFAVMEEAEARKAILDWIPVGTLNCVWGKVYKAGGALARHVEEHEDCLRVLGGRYVAAMVAMRIEFHGRGSLGTGSDIGFAPEDAG
ncbi:hypothetical protein HOY82DRAFT_536644 [Tuber indicum]|nr:hypothetical protein HOY82DRAFT_536644 [Tuber indicum]